MRHVKQIVVIIISVFSFQLVSAQSSYITHTLKQGENLSTLAKEYNTTVGDIMRMNGMHADTKLVYGSKIKIPSTKTQTTAVKQTSNTVTSTSSVTTTNEITHVVSKGETLYSISKKYNVSIEQLKAWNHLTDNNTKMGTLLIISDKGSDKFATTQKQSVETIATTQPVVDNTQIKQPDQNVSNNNTASEQNTNSQVVAQTQTNTQPVEQTSVNYSGHGFFASTFKERKTREQKNISGISKTFKTSSGWNDGKYYILANDIQPGTIVKITADNGNEVYAKVLWNMGDLKDNAGINFRVSNATAAALKEDATSFNLNVSF